MMGTLITFLVVAGLIGAFLGRGFFRTIGSILAVLAAGIFFCMVFLSRVIAIGIAALIILVIALAVWAIFRLIFPRRRRH